MPHPAFAVAVTFQIKPDCLDAFTKRIVQQASDSLRLEEGCLQFEVAVDEQDPHVIFLYEAYIDAAAFDVHRSTAHFADYNQTVADWIVTKDVRRLKPLEKNV